MKKWSFVFAAVMMHVVGFAQPELRSAAALQQELIAQIETEQSRNGPLSPGLIEPLTSLSILYEENGDTAPAVATIERAMQIIRANFGIFSIDQVPLVRRLMIRAEEFGDDRAAWDYEQQLLELARRNPQDVRSVQILRDAADNRIAYLDKFIAGEYPPQIEFGCYFAGELKSASRGCAAGSLERAARAVLNEAHGYYEHAIEIFTAEDRYANDDVRELEWAVIDSTLDYGKYLGTVREYCRFIGRVPDYCGRYMDGSVGCRRVDDGLRRLYDYDVFSEAPLRQRVDSLVRIADWKLFCDLNAYAHSDYEVVLALLIEESAPQAEIDRIFAPGAPVLLPTFSDSPLITEAPFAGAESIEVAFEVTRFGTTRGIEIGAGKKKPGADEIVRTIKRRRFRPYASDGVLVDSPRFVMRYYLSEREPAAHIQ